MVPQGHTMSSTSLSHFASRSARIQWCRGRELNSRHKDFQSFALPLSYPGGSNYRGDFKDNAFINQSFFDKFVFDKLFSDKIVMKKICIVGLGNMGSAIAEVLGKRAVGVAKGENIEEKAQNCEIVLLAVKPQTFSEMRVQLGGKLVISIMAGVSVAKIAERTGSEKIVRVMPNLPLRAEAGVSGWFAVKEVSNEEKNEVKEVLELFGIEIEVDNEDDINKITALSGSGPAYYYFLNRCMRNKAIEMGFSPETAGKIAGVTFLGAAKLLYGSGENAARMIQKIASKGGTTEAALNHLGETGVEKLFGEAVDKAYKKSKELNDNMVS